MPFRSYTGIANLTCSNLWPYADKPSGQRLAIVVTILFTGADHNERVPLLFRLRPVLPLTDLRAFLLNYKIRGGLGSDANVDTFRFGLGSRPLKQCLMACVLDVKFQKFFWYGHCR